MIRDDTVNFKVIAVVEDVPTNSHFHFNIAISLIIALSTVSYQTIRVSLANPSEALRYE